MGVMLEDQIGPTIRVAATAYLGRVQASLDRLKGVALLPDAVDEVRFDQGLQGLINAHLVDPTDVKRIASTVRSLAHLVGITVAQQADPNAAWIEFQGMVQQAVQEVNADRLRAARPAGRG